MVNSAARAAANRTRKQTEDYHYILLLLLLIYVYVYIYLKDCTEFVDDGVLLSIQRYSIMACPVLIRAKLSVAL